MKLRKHDYSYDDVNLYYRYFETHQFDMFGFYYSHNVITEKSYIMYLLNNQEPVGYTINRDVKIYHI